MDRMTEIGVYSTGPFAPVFARTAHLLTYSGAHGEEIHVNELSASISYSFNPLCSASIVNKCHSSSNVTSLILNLSWHYGFF